MNYDYEYEYYIINIIANYLDNHLDASIGNFGNKVFSVHFLRPIFNDVAIIL